MRRLHFIMMVALSLSVLVPRYSGGVEPSVIVESSPEEIIKQVAELSGKVVVVDGVIEKLERDKLNVTTVMICLEGGLKCRVLLSSIGRSAKLKGIKENKVALYEGSNNELLPMGMEITIRGKVKKEMASVILDNAVIKSKRR